MKELIENFKPINKQETRDKEVILEYLSYFDNLLTRENNFAHFTSSAFIVNQDYTKVLMAYHNIYKSYAWLGGHMDGDTNPLKVAIKEAKDESSISKLELITTDIISLDAIEVTGHIKKNNWVTPHIHLNVTYLFKANDEDFIHENLDENSSVKWLPIDEIDNFVTEENMLVIYHKIIDKMNRIINKWKKYMKLIKEFNKHDYRLLILFNLKNN